MLRWRFNRSRARFSPLLHCPAHNVTPESKKMKTLIAAVVGVAVGGFSAQGRAADDLPLSVTDIAPAISVQPAPLVDAVEGIGDAGSLARPELVGAAAVGAYLLYKGRKRRYKLI
jgi:hypothetical protein